ncbi:MAG: ABC transporter permease subunit [Limisphaerales bacterium]
MIGIALSFAFGLIIGGISGYFAGGVDTVIMRVCELIMSVPTLYLIIALRGTFPPDMSSAQIYGMIIIILSLIGWAGMARVIRGMALSLREQQYVLAARSMGANAGPRHFAAHFAGNIFLRHRGGDVGACPITFSVKLF